MYIYTYINGYGEWVQEPILTKGDEMNDMQLRRKEMYHERLMKHDVNYRQMYLIKVYKSRLSYRLKKWLLSLRWVNNWLWYRQEFKQYAPKRCPDVAGCRVCAFNCYCIDEDDNNTGILPDYKSIRRIG